MKKYLVIGNPLEHSLSPKIHNFWFKQNKINAIYNKETLEDVDLENFIKMIRDKKIEGANITVPFKEKIIKFIDILSDEARDANSVNTVYMSGNNIMGHNTDIAGFYLSLKSETINLKDKNILILGAGGVTPSIILGLRMIGVKKIIVSNRTKDKVLKLKERFSFIEVLNWGETVKANAIINTTSVGLKKTDKIQLNSSLFTPDTFFYDVIYNPKETNFLKKAKNEGCMVQNGLMMFINQAAVAFKTWHNIMPKIDKNLIEFLQND